MAPATQSLVHRSSLHEWHVAHGARFAESNGWLLPRAYGNPGDEADAARNRVGLADISAQAKWSLRGRGVPAVAVTLGIASPCSVAMLADGSNMACRLTEESLLIFSSTTHFVESNARFPSPPDVLRIDVTCAYAGLAVVGKDADTLVGRLTALDITPRAFPQGACAETELAGVQTLLIRPPAARIDEISVYVAWDVGEYVWERLCETGANLGLTPIGFEALRVLRAVNS